MSLIEALRGHFQEHIAKYAVLVLSILTAASTLMGSLAADLGGVHSQIGVALLMAVSGLGTAAKGVTYIKNLGLWQMLDSFGVAPGSPAAADTSDVPDDHGLPGLPVTVPSTPDLGDKP